MPRFRYFALLLAPFLAMLIATSSMVETSIAADAKLPREPEPYTGRLEPTEALSTPYFPERVSAPAGAPNILLVMTDDVGFAAASTFGGAVPTPNLDHLAARGLKYNQFHTTAICSPTRAALLTGRNHHAVSAATVVELASPYPGYVSRIPPSAATVARILRDNGYNTAMFGKDHNVPNSDYSPAGPFDQWPTGRGFEYFYGFVAGDTNQWNPALIEGITPVDNAERTDEKLLDERLVDRAIRWLHNQKAAAPDKPFFIYFAPGTAHAPQQAPVEWIARFRGQFDQGWDALREQALVRQKSLGVVPQDTQLAPRPAQIPAWDTLSAQQQRVYSRYMEVFAAMLSYQDAQFGRLLDEIERMGLAEDTLVVFIQGDNGASGEGGTRGTLNELVHLSSPLGDGMDDPGWLADNLDRMGGPDSYQAIPVGWAFAMSTPFPWVKQVASHLGGVRNGLVISWPGEIEKVGEVRTQYHHVIDIMPTLLDAAGIAAPASVDGIAQQAIDGVSMMYSFDDGAAPSKRRTQYYEILGNRGIYHDGWLANTTPRNMPWQIAQSRSGSDTTSYSWELYNLRNDFSQTRDLAKRHPDKLREMQAIFDREARRNHVYPIQDSGGMSRVMKMVAATGAFRRNYVFWGPDIRLPVLASPPIFYMPFRIEAELEIPEAGASGVVVAAGSQFGGWSFYIDEGRPVAYAAVSQLPGMQTRIVADEPLPSGPVQLRYEFDVEGEGGVLTIFVNDRQVARQALAHRPRVMAGNGETFDIGRDSNTPVTTDYAREGIFTGTIQRVEIEVDMPPDIVLSLIRWWYVHIQPRWVQLNQALDG